MWIILLLAESNNSNGSLALRSSCNEKEESRIMLWLDFQPKKSRNKGLFFPYIYNLDRRRSSVVTASYYTATQNHWLQQQQEHITNRATQQLAHKNSPQTAVTSLSCHTVHCSSVFFFLPCSQAGSYFDVS